MAGGQRAAVGFLWLVQVTVVMLVWWSPMVAVPAHATLVAYFPFEWSGRETSVLTGLCPLADTGLPLDLRVPSFNVTFVSANWPGAPAGQRAAQFIASGSPRPGYLGLGNVELVAASKKMTAALWTDTAFPPFVPGVDPQPIVLMARTTTTTGNFGNNFNWIWFIGSDSGNLPFFMKFQFMPSGGGGKIGFTSKVQIANSTWHHLALSISETLLTFYVNGTPETFTSEQLLTMSENYPLTLGGLSSGVTGDDPIVNPIAGRLDEVYLFDEALDDSQIAALMENTSPLPSEAPLITVPQPVATPSNASTTVLDGFSLAPQVQQADTSVPLQYFWAESSSLGCKVASINDPSAATVEVTLSAITTAAPLSLDLNVKDTFCSPTARTLVNVAGNSPTFGVALASNYDVYLGENLTITADAVGFPTPLVFWDEPTTVNATLPNGTSIIIFTYKTFASGPSVTFSNPTTTKRSGIEERQGSSTFVRTFSCLLRNSIGELRSANITVTGLTVVRPQNETGDGDGGDVGLIVGLAVGLPLAAILLCLVITTIVLFVILWKYGGRERKIKPPKPDYEALAYGSLLDDNVSLTKDQENNLRKLEDLLLEEDFVLTRAVCETMKATDAEQVAKALTYIYAGHGQAVELLKYFITKEVAASNKEGTLFRANSVSTKIFNCYARMIGIHYVWTIFALPVTELNVMALKAEGHRSDDDGDESTHTTTLLGPVVMEVDPSKMEEAADEQVNTLQLWLIAQKLFVALTRSHGGVPREIKQVLRHVKVDVEQKFSEQAAHKAVGGFLFLRFLCPALMAPQVYGLLKDPPHSTTQRQLILVAKVMQNLANDTLPGKKEGYMERLNDFITSNQQPMRQFYSTLIADADAGSSADLDVPSVVTLNSLVHMHRHISTNLDKLMADLQQDHEDVAEQLREIMDNIGNIDADLP